MSRARRWGFPCLLVSLGLHGALVGAALLSGPEARAARQPELPASSALLGSSGELEVPIETLAVPGAGVAVESEGAIIVPSVARVSVKPRPASRPSLERGSPRPVIAKGLGAEQGETKATGSADQKWQVPGALGLGYAIARAISQAAPAEAAWRELPVGHVGTVRIELAVDQSHHLSAARRFRGEPDEPSPPAVLEELAERALLSLRGGRFALSGSNQPGVEQLTIDVAIRARASDERGASVVVQKGFSGATPARPGRAYFRYGTGCSVEATVTVVGARP